MPRIYRLHGMLLTGVTQLQNQQCSRSPRLAIKPSSSRENVFGRKQGWKWRLLTKFTPMTAFEYFLLAVADDIHKLHLNVNNSFLHYTNVLTKAFSERKECLADLSLSFWVLWNTTVLVADISRMANFSIATSSCFLLQQPSKWFYTNYPLIPSNLTLRTLRENVTESNNMEQHQRNATGNPPNTPRPVLFYLESRTRNFLLSMTTSEHETKVILNFLQITNKKCAKRGFEKATKEIGTNNIDSFFFSNLCTEGARNSQADSVLMASWAEDDSEDAIPGASHLEQFRKYLWLAACK
ncbi:hypothetical protein WN48_05362 [Eufriesea mexicana]|nr:hypothetical protein WN48_05362 [Eufriesea mexicana]